MLYNIYPWERTDNLYVLIKRMKDKIHFPPLNIAEWLQMLIIGMINVDEEQRFSIKEVGEVIKANTIGLMIDWGKKNNKDKKEEEEEN